MAYPYRDSLDNAGVNAALSRMAAEHYRTGGTATAPAYTELPTTVYTADQIALDDAGRMFERDLAGFEEEIKANDAKIAELKRQIKEIQASELSDDELDYRLAANRAQRGDQGAVEFHLGRPETRRTAANNRISDLQYKLDDIDGKLRYAKVQKAYSNDNPEAAKVLDEEIQTLENKRQTLLKQMGITEPEKKEPPKGPEGNSGKDDDVRYKSQVKASIKEKIYKGKDGKWYLNDGEDRDALREEIHKVPHWEDDEELQDILNDLDTMQTVPEYVNDNSLHNLQVWLAKPENTKGDLFRTNKRAEFGRLWDELSDEEKNSPEAQKIFSTWRGRMDEKEYAEYLKKMDKHFREKVKVPEDVAEGIKKGYYNEYEDKSTGLKWKKDPNTGLWSAKGWKEK
jgi:hypothetical protein